MCVGLRFCGESQVIFTGDWLLENESHCDFNWEWTNDSQSSNWILWIFSFSSSHVIFNEQLTTVLMPSKAFLLLNGAEDFWPFSQLRINTWKTRSSTGKLTNKAWSTLKKSGVTISRFERSKEIKLLLTFLTSMASMKEMNSTSLFRGEAGEEPGVFSFFLLFFSTSYWLVSGHDAPLIAYDALLGALQAGGSNLEKVWEEFALRGILHGGDNDSTGVIVWFKWHFDMKGAAWYGAMFGFEGVPRKTWEFVEYRHRAAFVGDQLFRLAHNDSKLPFEKEPLPVPMDPKTKEEGKEEE